MVWKTGTPAKPPVSEVESAATMATVKASEERDNRYERLVYGNDRWGWWERGAGYDNVGTDDAMHRSEAHVFILTSTSIIQHSTLSRG